MWCGTVSANFEALQEFDVNSILAGPGIRSELMNRVFFKHGKLEANSVTISSLVTVRLCSGLGVSLLNGITVVMISL